MPAVAERGHTKGLESRIRKEVVGSDAFNLEYDSTITNMEIKEDIVSYFGEYRFQLQKFNYTIGFSSTPDEGFKLRDLHRGESMTKKAALSVQERLFQGKPVHREKAEFEGLFTLEQQLSIAQEKARIYWASPPGDKDQGYGDYGFVYEGEVGKDEKGQTQLAMTAYRVEKPTIEGFNNAFSLLTGKNTNFTTAEQFLKSPRVVATERDSKFTNKILGEFFPHSVDPKEQEKFKRVMNRVEPLIDELITVLRTGTKRQKIEAFRSLDNFVITLKKESTIVTIDSLRKTIYQKLPPNMYTLRGVMKDFNHEAPKVAGSCGSTVEVKSNDIFSVGSKARRNGASSSTQEWFICPKCNWKADGPIGNAACKRCGLTKEKFAEESGIQCD